MRFRVVGIQGNRLGVTRKGGKGSMQRLLGDATVVLRDGILRIDLAGLLKIAKCRVGLAERQQNRSAITECRCVARVEFESAPIARESVLRAIQVLEHIALFVPGLRMSRLDGEQGF